MNVWAPSQLTANHSLEQRVTAPITVIIPCYRCANKIARALDSVARQSLLPREVILVDDASGDDTLATLYQLQSRHGADWIKIIELTSNGGAGNARNAAWQLASQDYLAFLDADDVWHPQKLAIQYYWMCRHSVVVLTGHHCEIGTSSLTRVFDSNFVHHKKISRLHLLFSNRFSTPSVMVKRELPYRFYPEKRFSEDYLLWLLICFGEGNCYYLDLPLAYLDKAHFGVSGMSANLWQMQIGEIENYRILYNQKNINFAVLLFFLLFSWLKFIRRLVIVLIRKSRFNSFYF